jgi:hypothetical protein
MMVAAFLRERFRPIFLVVACFTTLAASAFRLIWPDALFDVGFALLLLAQFRTWDDLADRARDTVIHPDRVLVRAVDVTQLIAFCGALAVANICIAVARDSTGLAVAVICVLDLALGLYYLARTVRTAAGECALLAKYPALVLVVSGHRLFEAPLLVLAGALGLYLAVCIHEAWHDPASPLSVSFGGHS